MSHERRFHGDINTELRAVQLQNYSEQATCLFIHARDAYLEAEGLLGVQTDLGKSLRSVTRIGLQSIRKVYDIVAEGFRQSRLDLEQTVLPFPPAEPHRDRLEREWREYYMDECRLLAKNPEIVRLILQLGLEPDTDRARAAENALLPLLRWRYGLGERP